MSVLKYHSIIIALLVIFALPLQARRVGYAEARCIAAEYLPTPAPRMAPAADNAQQPYYIFGERGRFVIVSGDDAMPRVLGYGDGALDTDGMPPQLDAFLSFCKDVYDDVEAFGCSQGSTEPILLATPRWNQTPPFSRKCPTRYTGCVATAMATVMKFHNHPASGQGQHAYEWNGQTLSFDFGTAFDWANMANSYTAYTLVQAEAVAKLMYACCVAVDTNFGNEASGAQTPKTQLLAKYFGYSSRIEYLDMANFPAEQWRRLIINELRSGRPIIYRGDDGTDETGHAFVIDGCDADGLFHVNWGWGGAANGYFALAALRPYNDRNYSYRNQMTIKIFPYRDDTFTPIIAECDAGSDGLTFNSSRIVRGEPFFASLNKIRNRDNKPFEGFVGIALTDSLDKIKELMDSTEVCLDAVDGSIALSFGGLRANSDATPGDRLAALYRSGEEWRPIYSGTGAPASIPAFGHTPRYAQVEWKTDSRLAPITSQRTDSALLHSRYSFKLLADSSVEAVRVTIDGVAATPDSLGFYTIDRVADKPHAIAAKAYPEAYTAVFTIDGVPVDSLMFGFERAVLPPAAAVRPGFTFNGWENVPRRMPAHNITINGSYTPQLYHLTYIIDGAVYRSTTLACGQRILPEPVPARENMAFSGWQNLPPTMPAMNITATGTYTALTSPFSALTGIPTDPAAIVTIHTLGGRLICRDLPWHTATTLLTPGIYIINGHKTAIPRRN